MALIPDVATDCRRECFPPTVSAFGVDTKGRRKSVKTSVMSRSGSLIKPPSRWNVVWSCLMSSIVWAANGPRNVVRVVDVRMSFRYMDDQDDVGESVKARKDGLNKDGVPLTTDGSEPKGSPRGRVGWCWILDRDRCSPSTNGECGTVDQAPATEDDRVELLMCKGQGWWHQP